MAEGGTLTFSDPDGYARAFREARINLTITGAGDFSAQLTRLKLQHLEVYRCRENLPRIAYLSFPSERMVLTFPVESRPPIFGGLALCNGDIVFHSRGERVHQRSSGACEWGLMSLSADQLADCCEALTGQPIASPQTSSVLHPVRAAALRFQHLFSQACRLAETGRKLIERPEVARALEQELLHATISCLSGRADGNRERYHTRAAIVVRFEEAISERIDQKLRIPELCAGIGVPERTLRMCCAEILGVSPSRYLLLRRLNKARSALRHADASKATVAEVARNHRFLEFGRFAVTYRTIFGELPSTTLQRDPEI